MMRTLLIFLIALALPASALFAASPPPILNQAFIEQRIDAQIPMNLPFTDEQGTPVQLGDYFGAKPAILVLVYFGCQNLCPMTLRHVTEGLNGIALQSGRDFNVIVASFDPRDTPPDAARQKSQYLAAYKYRESGGWHFLTGPQSSIDPLKQAVGFHCTFDAQHNQFAHAAGMFILTPQGRLSHDFFGVDVSPADFESALRDAQAGKSSRVDQPDQQYCFTYDPSMSIYGRRITRILQLMGIVWVAMLLGYIGMHLTRDFRQRRIAR